MRRGNDQAHAEALDELLALLEGAAVEKRDVAGLDLIDLYVVGDADHRVHKLDPGGRVIASCGRGRGEGGQLFDPSGLAVDTAGRVCVADRVGGRGRVLGFAPDGQPPRHLVGR